ncbi:MAG: transposase [Syntrophothermus sp.]
MIDEFDLLIDQCSGAFRQNHAWKVGRDLAFGALNCMGKHTLTGMITASGHQFIDWSSAYRLFSRHQIDVSQCFDVACKGVLEELTSQNDIVAHMDDTILKKTGLRIPGTAWRRDPLGPPFQTNFIWGQRFLQISMALPDQPACSQSRAIPVDFYHCPTAKRPRKRDDDQCWQTYREQQKNLKLSKKGADRLRELRTRLDINGANEKELIVSVDGSYTNESVLKHLPDRVTLIGRIRKDTKLYFPAVNQPGVGRKKIYGEQLPTPEEIRQLSDYPWQEVNAWLAGSMHKFNVKVIKSLKWRSAGPDSTLQLIVIRPLGYRLTKSSKRIYKDPAYLICTNNELDIQKLLQAYLWRWEIEVNFRDEKTLMGCGQAQVRHPQSVELVPAFITAIYALLHLAAHKSLKESDQPMLPRPKWYHKKEPQRHTTRDLINNIKAQAWVRSLGINFSGFVTSENKSLTLKKYSNPCTSAMFYLRN